jgi:hypothetical protein
MESCGVLQDGAEEDALRQAKAQRSH